LPPVHPFFDLEGAESVQYSVSFLEQESSQTYFFDSNGLLVRIEESVPEGGPIVNEYEYSEGDRLVRHVSRFSPTQDPRSVVEYTYTDNGSARVITATDLQTGEVVSRERQTLDRERCALDVRYEDLRYDEVWRRTFFFDGGDVPVGVRASSVGTVTVGPVDAELSWSDDRLMDYTEGGETGPGTTIDFVYDAGGFLASFREDLDGIVREYQIQERAVDHRENWSIMVFNVYEGGGAEQGESIGKLEYKRTVTYRAR
jgi:hypothetical protein